MSSNFFTPFYFIRTRGLNVNASSGSRFYKNYLWASHHWKNQQIAFVLWQNFRNIALILQKTNGNATTDDLEETVCCLLKKKKNLSPSSPTNRQAPPQPLSGTRGHFHVLDWWWHAVSCSLPYWFGGCGGKQCQHLRTNLPDHWQPSDCGRPSPRHQTATPRT